MHMTGNCTHHNCHPCTMVSFGLARDLLLYGSPALSRGLDKSGSNRFLCTIFILSSPPCDLILKTGMFSNGCSITSYMVSSHDLGSCAYLYKQYISVIPYHLPLTLHIGPCGHNVICSFPVPS